MHELSIVQNILEIADAEVRKAKGRKVHQIDLSIGQLSGIEMEALLFAWEACVPGTVLEHAQRNIHHIVGKAKCVSCGKQFEIAEFYDPCPACGEFLTELTEGKELKVKQLVIS